MFEYNHISVWIKLDIDFTSICVLLVITQTKIWVRWLSINRRYTLCNPFKWTSDCIVLQIKWFHIRKFTINSSIRKNEDSKVQRMIIVMECVSWYFCFVRMAALNPLSEPFNRNERVVFCGDNNSPSGSVLLANGARDYARLTSVAP